MPSVMAGSATDQLRWLLAACLRSERQFSTRILLEKALDRAYHVHRLDLRCNIVSKHFWKGWVGKIRLPSSFSLTSSFLNSGTSFDMLAAFLVGRGDVSFVQVFVVCVQLGGGVQAMCGCLSLARSRVHPKHQRKARRQKSKLRASEKRTLISSRRIFHRDTSTSFYSTHHSIDSTAFPAVIGKDGVLSHIHQGTASLHYGGGLQEAFLCWRPRGDRRQTVRQPSDRLCWLQIARRCAIGREVFQQDLCAHESDRSRGRQAHRRIESRQSRRTGAYRTQGEPTTAT